MHIINIITILVTTYNILFIARVSGKLMSLAIHTLAYKLFISNYKDPTYFFQERQIITRDSIQST